MNTCSSFHRGIICILVSATAFSAAQAQSPPIVWQTPYSVDRRYESVKFTPKSTQLLAGGSLRAGGSTDGVLIKRFDAGSGAELGNTAPSFIYYGASEIALSPDGAVIITANDQARCDAAIPPQCEGTYLAYNAALERLAVPPSSNAPNYTVDYSPDGQLIALGGLWFNYAPDGYQNLRLVNAADRTVIRTMQGHLRSANDGGTLSVRFSPDGALLGSSGHDSFVRLWRVSDGALLRSINFDNTYIVDSVAFSPNGKFIAAGRTGTGAQVKVWTVDTGELVRTFDVGPTDNYTTFNKVTWTPDGTYLVAATSFGVGYGPNKIQFWNVMKGGSVQEYSTPEDRFLYDITFSPDGQFFAYAQSSQVVLARNPFFKQDSSVPPFR